MPSSQVSTLGHNQQEILAITAQIDGSRLQLVETKGGNQNPNLNLKTRF